MIPDSIVLAGIKHCGKSAIGRELAGRLGVPFLDSDVELLRKAPPGAESVRGLYRRLGADGFRRFEAEVIAALAAAPAPRVLALGGGAVENAFIAPETLRRLGELVWLDLPDEVAFARIAAEGLPPFLETAADPAAEFRRINDRRREGFRRIAALRFEPSPDETPEGNAMALLARLERPPEPAVNAVV